MTASISTNENPRGEFLEETPPDALSFFIPKNKISYFHANLSSQWQPRRCDNLFAFSRSASPPKPPETGVAV
ncbi:MAG TPA: hypothetical protein VIS74_00105 [Chthoniobacterales bacterium]